MDDTEVLTETLNSTLLRHSKIMQNYEVEVANMTAEIVRLRNKVAALESLADKKQNTKS